MYRLIGSRSKPFGQVGAPNSTNTRSKYSFDLSGSTITPSFAMTSDRSRTPSLPSVKRSHSRYPSSGRRRSTSTIGKSFVGIGTSNLFEGRVRSRPPPIFLQFGPPRQRPFPDETRRKRRQLTCNDLAVREPYYRFRPPVPRVQVRRVVVVVEHLNRDAVEIRYRRHRAAFNCPRSFSASATGSDASTSATPSPQSAGCAHASPRTAARPLPACDRYSSQSQTACAARALRAG